MQWLAPYAVHGAVTLDAMELAAVASRCRELLSGHARRGAPRHDGGGP